MAIEYDMTACPRDEASRELRAQWGFSLAVMCMIAGIVRIDDETMKETTRRLKIVERYLGPFNLTDENRGAVLSAHNGTRWLNLAPKDRRQFENEVVRRIRLDIRHQLQTT